MINCKRCKHYYKAFGVYSICYYEEPCSLKNHDGKCTDYEAKFPYNLGTWCKVCIEYLLPKKRVYCSGTSQDNRKREPNKYGHRWGKRRYLGYAVCDQCNAVENTKESVTKCPMLIVEKPNGVILGVGRKYPEPSYAPFPKEQE